MKIELLLTALSLVTLTHGSAVLTLDPPSGSLSGMAGSTLGWGFTLSNPSDFAVITSSNFCLGSSGVSSACVGPTIGTYGDFIAGNFTIAGPAPESPVVTEAFDASAGTGLGSFTINAGAMNGATDMGQIVATYDLYSVDPNAAAFDPNADLISTGNFLTAPGSVTVSAVPEPSYLWPSVALGAVGLGWRKLCRSKR